MKVVIFLKNRSGFTLIELLLVVMILGMLVGLVVPASNIVDKKERKKQTLETFNAIRTAILGPENRFDSYGKKMVGGYVGDVDKLPYLYILKWDKEDSCWRDTNDLKLNSTITLTGDSLCASPLALWDKETGKKEPGWKRTYLTAPVDFAPDDQVWDYTDGIDPKQDRMFLRREGADGLRLLDGWGRALIIYVDTCNDGSPCFSSDSIPLNLVFVSAGPDGKVSSDTAADGTYYHLDTSKTGLDEDNLVMRIDKNDWNYDDLKRTYTFELLLKIKEAIIGKPGIFVNGAYEPNGFIADIGNPEPLTGSYVSYCDGFDTIVYRCIKSHESSGSNNPPSSDYWEALVNAYRYNLFPIWEEGKRYYKQSLDALLVNTDYIYREGNVYKCIKDNYNEDPHTKLDYWKIDNEVTIPETATHLWDSTKWYYKSKVNNFDYYPEYKLYCGWKKPYLTVLKSLPITDGWKRPITAELDSSRNIVLRSFGPDTNSTTDDVVKTIDRLEYESPVGVSIKDTIKVDTANNCICYCYLYLPYNGSLSQRRIFADTVSVDSAGDTISFMIPYDIRFSYNPAKTECLAAPISIADSVFENSLNYSNTYIPVGRKSTHLFVDNSLKCPKYNFKVQRDAATSIEIP